MISNVRSMHSSFNNDTRKKEQPYLNSPKTPSVALDGNLANPMTMSLIQQGIKQEEHTYRMDVKAKTQAIAEHIEKKDMHELLQATHEHSEGACSKA